mgnify:CR=1 FL=1
MLFRSASHAAGHARRVERERDRAIGAERNRTAVATGTALSSGAIPETACTTGTTAGAIATGATASAVAALTDIADADIGDATAAASSTGPANAPVDAAVAAITPIATGGGLTD